jgi:hypothetical protein
VSYRHIPECHPGNIVHVLLYGQKYLSLPLRVEVRCIDHISNSCATHLWDTLYIESRPVTPPSISNYFGFDILTNYVTNSNTTVRIRHADHVAPSICKR